MTSNSPNEAWLVSQFDEFELGKTNKKLYTWHCSKCNNDFIAPVNFNWFSHGLARSYGRCPNCYPILEGTSSGEIELMDFIENFSGMKVERNLNVIQCTSEHGKKSKKQLDGFVKELNLAFEYNGLFWHSTRNGVKLENHLFKTIWAESVGIKLVHIREDMWKKEHDKTCELLKFMISSLMENNFEKLHKKIFEDKNQVELDRSIFNKCWNFGNYEIVKETKPVFEKIKDSGVVYDVPNCGKIVLKLKQ